MSNNIPENRIIPQTTQVPAGNTQSTPAAQPQAPVEAPLFNGTTPTTGADTFTTAAGASSAELSAQLAEVKADNRELKEDEGVTQENITGCETDIEVEQAKIDGLKEANDALIVENAKLNTEIREANIRIGQINTRINTINNLINENSGFIGGFINGIKGFFGNGVDVNALQTELANLKAEKEELLAANKDRRQQISENGGTIDSNNEDIADATNNLKTAEEIKEAQNAALKEIQKQFKEGLITAEQLAQATEAAYAAEAEAERLAAEAEAEAEKNAEPAEGTEDTTEPVNTENNSTAAQTPSKEQVDGTAAVIGDMLTNGEVTTDTMNAVSEGMAAQDPTTGEFNADAFQPAYIEAGFAPEEIAQRLEVISVLATYDSLGLGLNLDVETFQQLGSSKLDEVIETAMVQDTIKATSAKVIGKGATITSKKDMKRNAEAVNDFISAYSALNNYYKANDVENLEVSAFLNLSGSKLNDVTKGYTIGTSELQEMTNNAGSMMTTLRTAVSLDEAAGKSANIQFQENSHKAEDAIDNAEGKLGDSEDTTTIDEFRAEFLNLTSKFNNSDSDSAKQISIKAMETLYQRALNAEDGVNKDPYRNGINIAA